MTTLTKKQVTVNEEQRLFVIPCGGGYSCLGFDVCKERSAKIEGWILGQDLGAKVPDEQEPGTIEAYKRYQSLMDIARDICNRKKIRCNVGLTPQLVGLEGRRVEVVNCFGEKSRFYVGKSTGWMPCHLEIKRRDSTGGGAVCCTPFKSVTVVR
jgi:hypothetical protein